jgi:hypothetical protein
MKRVELFRELGAALILLSAVTLNAQTCDPNVTFTCYNDPAPCDPYGGYVVYQADTPVCTGASCGNGLFVETQNWVSFDVFYGTTCDSGTTEFCGTCPGGPGALAKPFVRPFEAAQALFKLKPITPAIYQRVYQAWDHSRPIKVNRFWWKYKNQKRVDSIKRLNAGLSWYMHQITYN